MGADSFQFKQFTVYQRQSAMKVGTDGILLGAWADVRGDEQRILDIGCGTGLLSLMMAQRSDKAMIDAVEIEPLAAAEARANAAQSPWGSRILVIEDSIQHYASRSDIEKYDLIISNPPYFLNSSPNNRVTRTAARHAALLPYDDLVQSVVQLLAPQGRFMAIFPYDEAGVFVAKAAIAGLYCNKKLNIYPLAGRVVKRVAAEFSFTQTPLTEEHLTIQTKDREYTEQYKKLTSQFYLRF